MDEVFLRKAGAIAIVGAALVVAAVNHFLYRLPPQTVVVLRSGVPTAQPDAKVYLMIRDCRRYTRRTGQWWWKRSQVDFLGCVGDPATEGEMKVIGEIPLAEHSAPLLSRYTFACDFCGQGRLLHSVEIPLGVRREQGAATLQMPPNLRLHEEEALQLMYTPPSDPKTTASIALPYVE